MRRVLLLRLDVSSGQREVLEALSVSRTAAHREFQRARALLLAADGVANTRICRGRCDGDDGAVVADPVRGSGTDEVREGRTGAWPEVDDSTRVDEEIVHLTQNSTPVGETHWSTRTMAKRAGVSKDTVQRVWSARGLKPHLVKTFKLSNDPRFEEKLIDVVGLYLHPPEQAVVLCMDEKSSVQALDRTQASVPLVKGRAATMTHDYKRHGTTTLFAALHALTGKVIGSCLPKHRHSEFLTFRELTEKALRRGIFHSVPDLIASIQAYLDAHNDDPKPFVWTATADDILAKVARGRVALEAVTQN